MSAQRLAAAVLVTQLAETTDRYFVIKISP